MVKILRTAFSILLCLFIHNGQAETASPPGSMTGADVNDPADDPVDSRPQMSRPEPLQGDVSDVPDVARMMESLRYPNKAQCFPVPQFMKSAVRDSGQGLFKQREDLEKYITCYLSPSSPARYTGKQDQTTANKKKQKTQPKGPSTQDQIENAATAFGLPPAFLACSYLKESTLDPIQVNPAGDCFGIAQIKVSTAGYMKSMTTEKLTKTEIDEFEKILSEDIKLEDPSNPFQQINISRIRRKAKLKLMRNDLSKSWQAYLSSNSLSSPKRFDEAMLKNPAYGIPAGALYYKYLASHIISELPNGPENSEALMQSPVFMQILAATYNRGPGKVSTLIKKATALSGPVTSAEDLLALLYKHSPVETRGHMSAIKTCMETGNRTAMIKSSSNKQRKSCEEE